MLTIFYSFECAPNGKNYNSARLEHREEFCTQKLVTVDNVIKVGCLMEGEVLREKISEVGIRSQTLWNGRKTLTQIGPQLDHLRNNCAEEKEHRQQKKIPKVLHHGTCCSCPNFNMKTSGVQTL